MNENNTLYDEVHAIMGKELLSFLKKSSNDFESEVPYNYYGNRGSVDMIEYSTIKVLGIPHSTHSILRVFELESRIVRLEELIRKLKDRMEYFPRYFEESRGLRKLGEVSIFLVLLATKENLKVVSEYLDNFVSAFSRTNQIFPADILSKTKEPIDNNFYSQIKRFHIVFFNPLKVHQIEINEDQITYEYFPFYRISAFQALLEISPYSIDDLRKRLKSIKIDFSNASEFLKAYKKYVNS